MSTRNYAVTAPQEANPIEAAMHDFLDTIDIQQVNVPEQLKELEKESMLNSSNIQKSFKEMRVGKTDSTPLFLRPAATSFNLGCVIGQPG